MGIVGLVFGVISIVGFFIGLIPFLGWFNWFNIPLALVGLVISIIAAATNENSRGPAVIGIVLCAIAVLVGAFRLMLGGGLL
jgi:formate-dependent nitrite reductase membrane component NrfD